MAAGGGLGEEEEVAVPAIGVLGEFCLEGEPLGDNEVGAFRGEDMRECCGERLIWIRWIK